jgi:hypothetical protein
MKNATIFAVISNRSANLRQNTRIQPILKYTLASGKDSGYRRDIYPDVLHLTSKAYLFIDQKKKKHPKHIALIHINNNIKEP